METDSNASDVAVIALGGNLPGAFASVRAALDAAVAQMPEKGLFPLKASRWWRSAAWPNPADPPFLNGVVLVRTALDPGAVLQALMALEADFSRRRSLPNAPRTLDLDLIAHGGSVMESPALTLPHPRAAERRFVMGPLAEIAPGWRHPVTGQTAESLASSAMIGQDACPE